MALTAGDGRTYKWYNGSAPVPFAFGEGVTYSNFSVDVAAATTCKSSTALKCYRLVR